MKNPCKNLYKIVTIAGLAAISVTATAAWATQQRVAITTSALKQGAVIALTNGVRATNDTELKTDADDLKGSSSQPVTITSSRSLAMTQSGVVNEARQAGNYPGARETGDKTIRTGGGQGQVKENGREAQLVAPASNGGNDIQVATPQGINHGTPGWRVSVGIFTRMEQIESITSLLKGSGFDAHSTRVTIASGTGEATLVWLGPYVERETAEKVSTLLIILTGEKGYVTRRAFCEHC